MSKLYEITERYQNLEMILENTTDEDLKEVLSSSLEEIEEEFNEKALNLVKYFKNIESDIDMFQLEENRIKKRKETLKKQRDSIKEYLFNEMKKMGKKKTDLGIFKLNIHNNKPTVKIIDKNLIDKKYIIEQEPKIDKNLILDDFKNNILAKGCEIYQGESLRIR